MCLILPTNAQRHIIHNDRIASLQVVAGENWFAMPVIDLNGDVPIRVAFDDMTHEYHRYTYSIRHCEADWSESEEIFSSDYIEGFADENNIDDIEESQNTNVIYTHYELEVPNDRCKLKMSGNYKLTIVDNNNENEPILTVFFMVVEPLAGVSLQATTNTDLEINGRMQQISIDLSYGSLNNVTDPASQIKTVVLQNGRWDNAIVNAKPQYVRNDGLRWEHNRDLIFFAGNEYRKFEMLDPRHTTMGLESVHWDGTNYHAYVWRDEPRPSYIYDEDANGSFYIRNSDNIENNTISEYIYTHFTLQSEPLKGDVYINGAWTNDQFDEKYKMEYDYNENVYKATVLLKQGYYSYQYLLLRPDGTTTYVPSEGSFFQTENKYQVLVYFKGAGERTDRLVAYNELQIN